MVFSSVVFLCVFLPLTFILYNLISNIKYKNLLLILASLIFYAYGEPIYILLMLFSSIVNYFLALLIDKNEGKARKSFLIFDVMINLGMLAIFKYASMAVSTLNNTLSLELAIPNIILPIGISFYTFQVLSYVIDVYFKKVEVQKKYLNLLLYISFFPQLIAGPIVKYRDINHEISNRKADINEIAFGMKRFIIGLSKKVLIANVMAVAADTVFTTELSNINTSIAWLGALAYMLQIFFDFSGYSDMAIGLGMMFGFHFKENFIYPYSSSSIKEFWRRWHISLSTWFRDYLYIPLGGNRKGKARTCINKIIVFFCTGLWHGANWTFVVWGLYHGLFLLLEEYLNFTKKIPNLLRHIYTILVVMIGFVIFRADTLYTGLYIIKQMFSGFFSSAITANIVSEILNPKFICMLFIAIIISFPTIPYFKEKLSKERYALYRKISYALSILLLIFCIVNLSVGTYNPFIYFRF